MLLSLLLMVSAAIDLDTLDSAGVQDLLHTWGLHGSFGQAFETLEIDGMILRDLQETDTKPSDFPLARSFHWKKLRQLVETNHPRRSLQAGKKQAPGKKPADGKPAPGKKPAVGKPAPGIPAPGAAGGKPAAPGAGGKPAPNKPGVPGLEKYMGLNIKRENAAVRLGTKGDFALYRTGPKAGAINGDLTVFGNLNVMHEGKVMNIKQFIKANAGGIGNGGGTAPTPKPKPKPATCSQYKNANKGFLRGMVTLVDVTTAPPSTRSIYCECGIADGCWTLVASIHEDNIAAKCDKKDRWATTDGGKDPKNTLGTGNWFSDSKFGSADKATTDDYKSIDYSNLQASDVMIWHVPNDTPASQYYGKSTYQYRTHTGFLQTKGEGTFKGSLAGIYGGKYKPQHKKYPKCYTGLVVPTGPGGDRSFLKGNPSDFYNKEIAPNSKGESDVGYITFTKVNNEQGVNAMCAGIKYKGCNAEHACIGAGGYLPESAPRQCSDFSGWDWSGVGKHTGWSASMSLTKSAIFLFVNDKPDPSKYARSCRDYVKKNPNFKRGIVKIFSGGVVREAYCDNVIPGGPWTLVASVHEDNIKAKCDKNDLWATVDGGKNSGNKLGTGNWWNDNTFGSASRATKADYKSEDYFKLQAKDIMIWHVPNDSKPSQYESKTKYEYRTHSEFIQYESTGEYAGTLAGIYADKYRPEHKKYPKCWTGLVVPVGPGGNRQFLKGSASDFHNKEIAPNSRGESQPGYITFTKVNNEQGVNAMCAGIKYTGCNAEHACIGAGGYLPESAPKQCSDFSGWDWSGVGTHSGWSASMSLTKSAIFMFVNDVDPNRKYASSCKQHKQMNPSFQRGIVRLKSGGKMRKAYCEATLAGGPWTLVASVHEDNIGAKCDKNDLWATTDGGKNPNNKLGTGNWWNDNTFGSADQATNADYKSPDYFKLKASDVMIWHVPNGASPSEYYTKPKYMYRTHQNFIPGKSTGKYAGTLAGIYADKYRPEYKKYPKCWTGLVIPTGPGGNKQFFRGKASDFHSKEIAPNSRGESQPGYITFTKSNNEQGVNAMCAGLKYTGCNAEHACIGAGGHLPESAPRQCSDFSGWDWSGVGTHNGWSASKHLTEAAIFILVNEKN